jgi:copper chaperone
MTRIHIANMTCGGCAKGVTATLRAALPGVDVAVDLERREVTLKADAAPAALTALRADGWDVREA